MKKMLLLAIAIVAMSVLSNAQNCSNDSQCGWYTTRCGAGGFCLTLQDDPANCGSFGNVCPDVTNPGDGVCHQGVCTCEECDPDGGGGYGGLQPAQKAPVKPPMRIYLPTQLKPLHPIKL